MRPEAVLLDMDGTLVDAFGPIVSALNRTLADFGLPEMSDADIRRHTGRGECSMISLFGERREEAAARFLEYHDEHLLDVRPMPGAPELLAWLKRQGIPVAIVTSKHQDRAEKQLAHLGWQGLVDCVIGLCEGRRQKPDPHTLFLACEALDVPPDQAVMAGDGTADMKAARRAGSLPVGLTHDFSEEELTQAGAARCFDSLHAMRAWLAESFTGKQAGTGIR